MSVAALVVALLFLNSDLVLVGRVLEMERPSGPELQTSDSDVNAVFTVVEVTYDVKVFSFQLAIPGAFRDRIPGTLGTSCLGTFIEDGRALVTAAHCLQGPAKDISITLPKGGLFEMSCKKTPYWVDSSHKNDDCKTAESGDWAVCRATPTSKKKAEDPIQLSKTLTQPNTPVYLLHKAGVSGSSIGSVSISQSTSKCFVIAGSSVATSGTGLVVKNGSGWELLAVYSGGNHELLFSSVLTTEFGQLMGP